MKREQLKELFQRYLENRCTSKEIESLFDHFNTDNESYLRTIIFEEIERPLSSYSTRLKDRLWKDEELTLKTQLLYGGIREQIERENNQNSDKKVVRFIRLRQIAIAASLLLCLGIGWYFASNKDKGEAVFLSQLAPKDDINPGTRQATLTLADGRILELGSTQDGIIMTSDGIVYQNGSALGINAIDNGTITLATPKGGHYKIELSDGSKIWLNSGSTLSYPNQFTGGQRRVSLQGEAYFEVAKNAKQPFIVSSADQDVTVLGTHFTVKAYPDEPVIRTSLLEGSVRVEQHNNKQNNSRVLLPNQQALFRKGTAEISISSVDPEAVTDWKNGEFVFKGESLKEAMQKIARWYDVDIVYEGPVQDQVDLGGWVSRDNKLSKVLEWIESTSNLRFKIDGNRVIVTN